MGVIEGAITVGLLGFLVCFILDALLSGLLRSEIGGGLSGAARGAGREWIGRRKRSAARKRKARAKSRAGRFVNALLDELASLGRGIVTGWHEGRTRARARRRERWEQKPPWWRRVFGPSDPSGEPEQEPEQTPNGEPERDPNGPNGEPEQEVKPEPERTDTDPKTEPEQDPSVATATPATAPNGAATRGINVTDFSTAQAVIAAWEAVRDQFEELTSKADSMTDDAEVVADNSGDFSVGGESDVALAMRGVMDSISTAKERVEAIIDALHDEWDAHIQAAEGRTAGAHAPFQEV